MGIAPLERVALKSLAFVHKSAWLTATMLGLCLTGLASWAAEPPSNQQTLNQQTLLIIEGAPGDLEFETNFNHQAKLWREASASGACRELVLDANSVQATNDYQRLKIALEAEPKEGPPLWLVFIGHGTFDGKEARFNLRGPDVSASELVTWLKPFRRPLAVINTASASAPFLNKLSGTNRVIITSTRSGNEHNFARFGENLAEVILAPEADLDKDGLTSLLEAFLVASRRTAEWYKLAGRLATEHPLLDDNGDGAGTPADWFRGVRATKKPKENSVVDGLLAIQWHLRDSPLERKLGLEEINRRNALERAIYLHREKKSQMAEEEYYRQLEKLLLDLARFYETNSLLSGANAGPAPERSSTALE
jgi:hypothetical protein